MQYKRQYATGVFTRSTSCYVILALDNGNKFKLLLKDTQREWLADVIGRSVAVTYGVQLSRERTKFLYSWTATEHGKAKAARQEKRVHRLLDAHKERSALQDEATTCTVGIKGRQKSVRVPSKSLPTRGTMRPLL